MSSGKPGWIALLAAVCAGAACAAAGEPLKTLEPFEEVGWVVAVPQPAGTLGMSVSPLEAEPRSDLQSGNLAEAQGYIAVRAGIF